MRSMTVRSMPPGTFPSPMGSVHKARSQGGSILGLECRSVHATVQNGDFDPRVGLRLFLESLERRNEICEFRDFYRSSDLSVCGYL